MGTALAKSQDEGLAFNQNSNQFVTVAVGGQMFGIPVLTVRDVLRSQSIANIPLSQAEIAGLLNLRGRIVTAVDLRVRLKMTHLPKPENVYNVVVESKNELYSLLVDLVGDVMTLPLDRFEKNPANLEGSLKAVSAGVYKLKDELMIVLDIERLLNF